MNESLLDLRSIESHDLMLGDREMGVSPVPLYTFSDADWELFASGNPEALIERLKEFGIMRAIAT
jgi:hypothetical protein